MILPHPTEIAETYSPPGYADPWDCVEDFQRVLEYTAEHPDLGSSAVASRLDFPRSRIRPWMNGSRPDVVRGIQAAERNGWTASSTDETTEKAIVELAAWTLAGGSLRIKPNAFVSFTVPIGLRDEFERIALDAGLSYEIIREDESNRATEARVNEDSSVLARVLYAMDVPAGSKSEDNPTSLPDFVNDLDDDLLAAFTRIYVLNRGAEHEDKDTLTMREQRADTYLDELVALLEDVSEERITRTGKTITISAEAARRLLEPSEDHSTSNSSESR